MSATELEATGTTLAPATGPAFSIRDHPARARAGLDCAAQNVPGRTPRSRVAPGLARDTLSTLQGEWRGRAARVRPFPLFRSVKILAPMVPRAIEGNTEGKGAKPAL